MAQAAAGSGKLGVFISYSRDDIAFADQLDAALRLYGFTTTLDRHGIAGGEDWQRRLGNMIRDADTVVFVLSPTSAASEVCAWEARHAVSLGKRILPVVCNPLGKVQPPGELARLNYVFFCREASFPEAGFGTGLARLVAALESDLDWLREHTRLLRRATEWDDGGRPDNRLLSGGDVAAAKSWAARRPKTAPEPTPLHLEFILASEQEEVKRSNELHQRLEAVAAAQAEREAALRQKEEALAQAAAVRRTRAWLIGSAFLVVSLTAGVAIWQWRDADRQRATAVLQTARAHENLAKASDFVFAISNRFAFDDDAYADSLKLFMHGAEQGDARSMTNIGYHHAEGRGVPQDYAKALEWFEKAAALGQTVAMRNIGALHEGGLGVPRNPVKAREWYEKAAEHGDAAGLVSIGAMYEGWRGGTTDPATAADWYRKAAAKGNLTALRLLAQQRIQREEAAGRYSEALDITRRNTREIEAAEVARHGRPRDETALALIGQSWRALLAGETESAIAAADGALKIRPASLGAAINRAHALMVAGQVDLARAIYLNNKGKHITGQGSETWEQVVRSDFKEMRKAGITHPAMTGIEAALGIAP